MISPIQVQCECGARCDLHAREFVEFDQHGEPCGEKTVLVAICADCETVLVLPPSNDQLISIPVAAISEARQSLLGAAIGSAG